MAQHDGTFDGPVAALGGSPSDDALDLWADPAGAARALEALGERGTALIRAATDLGGGQPGFAPEPQAPFWLLLTRGSPEIRACPSIAGGEVTCETRRVTRVTVECAPTPDGEDGAVARVSLSLDRGAGALGTRVLVGEAWARDEDTAAARVRAAAGRLARALSVPASLPGAGKGDGDEPSAESAGPLPARSLARFSLRSEGPRLVLRDLASRGPRESFGIHLIIGLVFAAAAAAAWLMFARNTGSAGPTAQGSLAWLGGSALLTLAAVAFLGVARFARRYGATSAPLVAFGGGKVIVAPWVSRTGAVGLDLEGRFGAAIDLIEVRGVSVQERAGRHAVEVATDHGPMDVLLTDDPAVGRYLVAALQRAADDLRPKSAPTARQRARARAAG